MWPDVPRPDARPPGLGAMVTGCLVRRFVRKHDVHVVRTKCGTRVVPRRLVGQPEPGTVVPASALREKRMDKRDGLSFRCLTRRARLAVGVALAATLLLDSPAVADSGQGWG